MPTTSLPADSEDSIRILTTHAPVAGSTSWKNLYLAEERPTQEPSEPPAEEPVDPGEEGETPTPPTEPELPDEPETPEEPIDEETPTPPEEPETPDEPEAETPSEPTDPATAPAITPIPLGQTTTVDGGRVTTFTVGNGQDIASIKITDDPEHGAVTVNPDNTLALVLSGSDHSGGISFGFDITYANGATETGSATLNVTAPKQEAGWGEGKHYMLETDANGELVIETGDNHRKVYVSESNSALTRADIAAREGVSEGTVTGKWLLERPEYGGSESKALATDIGMDLWFALHPIQATPPPSSNWLMFEKGYEYEGMGGTSNARLITAGYSGESPLQPIYISSWGQGERPVIKDKISIFQLDSHNIVLDGITPEGGITNLGGDNFMVNDSEFSGRGLSIQNVDGFTLRDSDLSHIIAPEPTGDTWTGAATALYVDKTGGILLEHNTFHHNGWEDNYLQNSSSAGGMPPNQYSHNLYLQYNTTDVTFRDNITSQAASIGAQFRGGAFVEDNIFLDNNVAVNVLGGDYNNFGPVGNFTFFTDNLITSGGHKSVESGYPVGARTLGITDRGRDTTFLDNIIAHLADPNNPDEQAEKGRTDESFVTENGIAYDDTIIFNWVGKYFEANFVENNTPGLDEDLANQTTIQNFAASLLGKDKATITEMMDAVLAGEATVTADDIIAYFQAGFGIAPSGDGGATNHRFIPDALAGGIRWDNRINWDSEELPTDGDSVDLGGNHVQYGGTTQIDDLDLSGGALYINHGKLTVDGALETAGGGGLIQTINAGQFWTDGYDYNRWLKVEVDGGRFANTGDVAGRVTLIASEGQTLLATSGGSYTVSGNTRLRIEGSDAKIGFDGPDAGRAKLKMEEGSNLVFKSDVTGFSTIEEFRSGHWDQTGTPVTSSVAINGTLKINLKDYAGGAGSHILIAADEITGQFDEIQFRGLGNNLDAKLVVDYEADLVRLDLSVGQGQRSTGSVDGNQPGGAVVSAVEGTNDMDMTSTPQDGLWL